MGKQIKVERFGIIHFYAQCDNCDWDDAINGNKANRNQVVRNKIYSHVRKTGHKVTLETGNSTYYSLNQP